MKMRFTRGLITAAVCAAVLSGCSAASHSSSLGGMAPPSPTPMPAATAADAPAYTARVQADSGAAVNYGTLMPNSDLKIIYSGSMNIETKDLQTAIQGVNALVQKYKAFVTSSSKNNGTGGAGGAASASFEIRVPKASFNDFMNGGGQIGNVVSQSVSSQDVTSQYYDTDTRLKALKIKHDRLLDMMSKATDTKNMLDIENALSDTEVSIDQLTGQLNQLSSLVDYSTVDISISVVSVLTPVTRSDASYFGGISARFGQSLAAIAFVFTGAIAVILGYLPIILLLAVAALLIWYFAGGRKWIRRRRENRNAPAPEKFEPEGHNNENPNGGT